MHKIIYISVQGKSIDNIQNYEALEEVCWNTQGFRFVFEQQMNQEWQQMVGGPGGHLGPLVGGPGGQTLRKLLGFQHLNDLLVHVFLPIFASIFTYITALLCVRDNHPDSTKNYKKIQVLVHQDVLNK